MNGSPDFFLRRERVAGLEEVAASDGSISAVVRAGSPEPVSTLSVTPSFFPILGIDPALGRTFLEEEMGPGRGAVGCGRKVHGDRFAADRLDRHPHLAYDPEPSEF